MAVVTDAKNVDAAQEVTDCLEQTNPSACNRANDYHTKDY